MPTEEELSGDDRQLLRQAGAAARRPLTRSSIKPKLLFQEELKQRKLENGEVSEDDEEAVTDVEVLPSPSRGKGKMVMPIPESLQEATPPPTVRKAKRGTFLRDSTQVSTTNGRQKSHSTPGPASSQPTAPAALHVALNAAVLLLYARRTRKLAVSTPRLPCRLTAASNSAQPDLESSDLYSSIG